jgi:uncharacterized protein
MEKQNTVAYNSAGLFLITIGLVLVNTLIFSYIGRFLGQVIWDVDVTYLVKGNMEFSRPHSSALRLTQFLSQIGGFIFSVYVVVQLMKRKLLDFTSLNKAPSLKWFVVSLVVFILCLPSLEWLAGWNSSLVFPESLHETWHDLHAKNIKIYDIMLHYNNGIDLFINLFVMALLPAFAEELLFRGLIMRIFRKMFGNIHIAVWITALVFALIHMQAFTIVPMIIMAAIFGYLYYLTGSLWIPILLHFLNNASVVLMRHYNVADDSLSLSFAFTIVSAILGVGIFIFLYKRTPKPQNLSLE